MGAAPTRRDLLELVTGRSVTELTPASLPRWRRWTAQPSPTSTAICSPPEPSSGTRSTAPPPITIRYVEGARTTAAMAASRFGPVLKVSEDGLISFYDGTKIWDI